jgi:hypothetical protein
MRAKVLLLALVGVCAAYAPGSSAGAAERQVSVPQINTDLSAAEKRKKPRPTQQAAPVFRHGFADPSIGPDGRPYRVPEYLRGQCYIDDGYGRFSACNNRN